MSDSELTEEEKQKLADDFEKWISDFVSGMKPLEPEFEAVINKHFWDLLM